MILLSAIPPACEDTLASLDNNEEITESETVGELDDGDAASSPSERIQGPMNPLKQSQIEVVVKLCYTKRRHNPAKGRRIRSWRQPASSAFRLTIYAFAI
jgi:hypothetical protein